MNVDDEGHGQIDDVFHRVLEELFHFVLFPGRDFQDQFVMDLDQELALQDRRVKFLLLISGKARRRPNMVTAMPDSFAEAMRPFM